MKWIYKELPASTHVVWCVVWITGSLGSDLCVSLGTVGIENLFVLWQIITFNFLFFFSLDPYTVSENPPHVLSAHQAPGWIHEVTSPPCSGPHKGQVTHWAPSSAWSQSQQEAAAVDPWEGHEKGGTGIGLLETAKISQRKKPDQSPLQHKLQKTTPLECTLLNVLPGNRPVNQGTMINGLPFLDRCGGPTHHSPKANAKVEASLWYECSGNQLGPGQR